MILNNCFEVQWSGLPGTDWIITIATACGVLFAILGYYKLIESNRDQQKQFGKQQFESTFFNMLSMLNQISQNAVSFTYDRQRNPVPHSGLEFYKLVYSEMRDLNLFELTGIDKENFKSLNPEISIRQFDEIAIWSEKSKGEDAILRYEIIFKRHHSYLSHFFRYIHNIVDFAIIERKKFDDEGRYINLIQAQLSSDQLLLLFYNCLGRYSINVKGEKKFKERIDFYQLLKNIEDDEFIRILQVQYPMTIFRFLSDAERAKKKVVRDIEIAKRQFDLSGEH